MGAFAAAELARRADPLRAPVVLLEAGDFEAAAPASMVLLSGVPKDGGLRPALIDGERVIAKFETVIGRGIGFGRPGLFDWSADGDCSPQAGLASEADCQKSVNSAAYALGLDASLLKEALCFPNAGALHAPRLHEEVLALARTRGAITRPQVKVTGLVCDPVTGQVQGVETDGGSYSASQVLICDLESANRLAANCTKGLSEFVRQEFSFPSKDFEAGTQPLGELRGSVKDLFEANLDVATDDPFRTFFGGDEVLEYPYPCLHHDEFETIPNALDGCLIAASRQDRLANDGQALRERLAEFASTFAGLEPVANERCVRYMANADGLPVVGPVPGQAGVFVALGLGLRAAQVAAGLAPGIAAQMRGDAIAAFDAALFAPRG